MKIPVADRTSSGAGDRPEVTVLLCVYNDQGFIDQAVESILKQTFRAFEFLIVDDASTDDTPHRLARWKEMDGRIRVFANDRNLGLTQSLNIGLRSSRASLIARMDSDDISEPDRLERQCKCFREDESCHFVASDGILINEKGKTIRGVHTDFKGMSQLEYLLTYGNPFIHSSMMMKRDTVISLGGYDEQYRFGQDYELWCRSLQNGYGIQVIRRPLIRQRVRATSLSSVQEDYTEKMVHIRCKVLGKSLGMDLTDEEIKRLIRGNVRIKQYQRRTDGRKKIKDAVSLFSSGKFKTGFVALREAGPYLFDIPRKPINLPREIGLLLAGEKRR